MKFIKFNSGLRLFLILGFALVAVYVFAQQTAPSSEPNKLREAIALLADGEPQQARELIASIDPNDPEQGEAQCYNALCLYELKDMLGFLKAAGSPVAQAAAVAPDLRENLTYKQIEVFFHYRRFDELLAKADLFQKEHPDSTRSGLMAEYRLAALFERGMKKVTEASSMTGNQLQQQGAGGKANLEEFLALASALSATSYSQLQSRNLQEDIWIARIALGDEKKALEEVPIEEVAKRERFNFLRVQLYQKLEPQWADRNLQMMADFIEEFPESKSRKRVEFDMASISFPKGKLLWKEADAAEQSGDTVGASEKRDLARRYFEFQRTLQARAVADKAAGIEDWDVRDLREDLLYSYLLEKDYANLSSLTSAMIKESTPGDLNWMLAKVFDGIAMAGQAAPKLNEAGDILDEVLALNFKNKPDHDHLVIAAAKWRMHIALLTADREKVLKLIHWVQGGNCTKNLKVAFMQNYTLSPASRK